MASYSACVDHRPRARFPFGPSDLHDASDDPCDFSRQSQPFDPLLTDPLRRRDQVMGFTDHPPIARADRVHAQDPALARRPWGLEYVRGIARDGATLALAQLSVQSTSARYSPVCIDRQRSREPDVGGSGRSRVSGACCACTILCCTLVWADDSCRSAMPARIGFRST